MACQDSCRVRYPDTRSAKDKYSLEYIKEVEQIWSVIKNDIKNKPMDGGLWSFKYSRPGNYPTRRIAAISRLLAENFETGIFRVILKSFEERDNSKSDIEGTKAIIKNTESIFLELYDEYWSLLLYIWRKKVEE